MTVWPIQSYSFSLDVRHGCRLLDIRYNLWCPRHRLGHQHQKKSTWTHIHVKEMNQNNNNNKRQMNEQLTHKKSFSSFFSLRCWTASQGLRKAGKRGANGIRAVKGENGGKASKGPSWVDSSHRAIWQGPHCRPVCRRRSAHTWHQSPGWRLREENGRKPSKVLGIFPGEWHAWSRSEITVSSRVGKSITSDSKVTSLVYVLFRSSSFVVDVPLVLLGAHLPFPITSCENKCSVFYSTFSLF